MRDARRPTSPCLGRWQQTKKRDNRQNTNNNNKQTTKTSAHKKTIRKNTQNTNSWFSCFGVILYIFAIFFDWF